MHLFICATTLQLAIAEKIILSESLTHQSDILFLGKPDSKRNLYYLERIGKIAAHIYYFYQDVYLKQHKNLSQQLIFAEQLCQRFKQTTYDHVYISNINSKFYCCVLQCLTFSALYSFDDGVANLNRKSEIYKNFNTSFLKKWLHRRIGRRYFPDDLLGMLRCHYTIFKQKKNIIANTQYVSLMDTDSISAPPDKTIKILIGSVYTDICQHKKQADELIRKINHLVLLNHIDLHLPHPRQEMVSLGCETLITHKMSETVITDYLAQGYQVIVYGFGSTVQFNIHSMDHVTNVLIDGNDIAQKIKHVYDHLCDDSYFRIHLDHLNQTPAPYPNVC